MPKLHQIIAIEDDLKNKTGSAVAALDAAAQKPDLFNGLVRTYRPKDENGEGRPPESKRVQLDARKEIDKFAKAKGDLINLAATKDWANMEARGDVEVDGNVILADVPVTNLMFLTKQFEGFRAFVDKLPVLDEAEDWKEDSNTGQYRTEVTTRQSTKKIQKPVVAYEATKEHPAQVAMVPEDIVEGYWDQTKLSAALRVPEKEALIAKIDALIGALKLARGKANEVDAPRQEIADTLFEFVLA